jgi:hypothetical protein
MGSKQTAVDFFMNSLEATSYSNGFWKAYEKAKEIEKEQIIMSYLSGDCQNQTAGQYYNETYGK